MAQYSTTFDTSVFEYDSAKELFKTVFNTSNLTGFTGGFEFSAISILKYDTTRNRFCETLAYYEIDSSGNLYVYTAEKFNGKITIITDI